MRHFTWSTTARPCSPYIEAWREGSAEYATVALRYESRDVTRNRATGEIVAGDDRVTQTTEVWTFVRRNNGDWLIAAIQEA